MRMSGQVAQLHALMPVALHLFGLPDVTIEFVVDTGFSVALSLPLAAVRAMGLPFLEDTRANLANDTDVILPVHVATIVWQGVEKRMRVLATGRRPLLGTSLLNGSYLGIEYHDGGPVHIEERP
jgi:clan AA aspartic protease